MTGNPAQSDVLVAVDPGRSKCGLAVVRRDLHVIYREVVPAPSLVGEVQRLLDTHGARLVVVGRGTGSAALIAELTAAIGEARLVPVDESYTSEAARRRFIIEVPARGLQRLVPRSLRTPWRPYDDFVAVILAERYWSQFDPPGPA